MATIKVNQASMDELKSAIAFSAEQTSQAAELVAKVVNGISGMSFSAKYGLESDLTSLKSRLNKQAQLSQACYRAVQEAVDALAQVDDSAGSSAKGVWNGTSIMAGAALAGAVPSGLPLAARELLKKVYDINCGFIDGTPGGGSTSTPNIDGNNHGSGADQSAAQAIDHSIPLISSWTGNLDTSVWPDTYRGGGCAVASTASALSGLLGKNITPKQIMGYQENNVSMNWCNCESALGVTTSIDQTGQVSSIDAALNRYLNDPSRYSAPIIGSSNPQHYVVVTGKNEDGSYSIIDSSGFGSNGRGAPTYIFSPSTPQLNGTVFKGNLTQVIQYQKNS